MYGCWFLAVHAGKVIEVRRRKVVVVVEVVEGQRGGFKDLDGGKRRKVRIVFSQFLLLLRT